MNIKEHRKNFNQRWNITISDSNQEVFQKFKRRVLNIFTQVVPRVFGRDIDDIIKPGSVFQFCQYYSIEEKLNGYGGKITIIEQLSNKSNEREFYRLIEVILSLDIYGGYDPDGRMKQILINALKEAVEISNVNVTISKSASGVIFYPKGERKLDDELVNKTLLFLNSESNQHFEFALKFYQNNNSRDSADRLRRSLEEFLRYKLGNQKGLEQNIAVLQKTMKTANDQSQIRNVIFTTFNYIDKYFNENSKHGDKGMNESENEFLIYQVGLLMRYIDKVISKRINKN